MFGFWQAVSGLAIFMIGIKFMEDSIRLLAGRNFKLFIKKQASVRIKASASGAFISALLQSSSAVNLITLAFVGSGILKLPQALAVILGSNLGTTATGWIIALVGFRIDLAHWALPLIAFGGLVWLLISIQKNFNLWGKLFLGAGFLFLGLEFMKIGVGSLFSHNIIVLSSGIPLWLYLLSGLLFTAAIQSSSATIAIVLSLVHGGSMEVISAAAVVLGAEIGTAFKLLPASLGGNAVKRQVAIGSILFNLIPAILVFPLLHPILDDNAFSLLSNDPLVVLVAFQTTVNFLGIVIFLPFIDRLSRLLEKNIRRSGSELKFLSNLLLADHSIALEAFRKECHAFCMDNIDFAFRCFDKDDKHVPVVSQHEYYLEGSLIKRYDAIKQIHGGIREYYIQLSRLNDTASVTEALDRLVRSVRNGMYASKNMKDIIHDIEQLSNSSNNTKYRFFCESRDRHFDVCIRLLAIMLQQPNGVGEMKKIYADITGQYEATLQYLYEENIRGLLNETEISTLVNFNRELVSAEKSLFFAVKDLVFNETESTDLEHLPGFIR
jgi:phosphate:Na+ symporter